MFKKTCFGRGELMTVSLTYYDFAENDYQYFMTSYNYGIVANMMGAMAQGICEKYMKHIIELYDVPATHQQQDAHESVLRTHNLDKLIKFLRNNMNIEFSEETEYSMKIINGFYFTTRYPGDDSSMLDERDIKICAKAIENCRNEINEIIKEQDEYKIYGHVEDNER